MFAEGSGCLALPGAGVSAAATSFILPRRRSSRMETNFAKICCWWAAKSAEAESNSWRRGRCASGR
eukprot:scaffold3196_cov92-Isochrysis_galbana.AAC.2